MVRTWKCWSQLAELVVGEVGVIEGVQDHYVREVDHVHGVADDSPGHGAPDQQQKAPRKH